MRHYCVEVGFTVKYHILRRCRAFAKGDLEGPQASSQDEEEPRTAEATFIPGHAILNARLAHLHARLPYDEHAQVYMRTPTYVKMKPTQPIVWTNHEVEDLTRTIEYTNGHLLAVAKAIEHISKVIDNTWVNLMFMAFFFNVGSWVFTQIKLV